MDAAHPGMLVRICHRHLYRKRQDRIQRFVDGRLHHRNRGSCRIPDHPCMVRKETDRSQSGKSGSEREINRKETIIKNMKKAGNYQTLSSGGYPLCRFHFLINM